MRALHVFPVYPGEREDGSSAYSRALTRGLAQRGVEVCVLSTTARGPRLRRTFDFEWPAAQDRAGLLDGVGVRRFASLPVPSRAGALIDRAVKRGMPPAPVDRGEEGSMFDAAAGWPSGLERLALAGRGPRVPGLLWEVRRRAAGFDVILAAHAPFGLMGWVQRAARAAGTPVVLLPFMHEGDPLHHLPSLHAAYRDAAAVLALSPHTAALLERHVPGTRAVALGAGADLAVFDSPGVSGERFRRRHGLEGRRLLLFVGRKEAGKRYDLALAAAAGLPEDVTLVLVGRDVDRAPLPAGVVHMERLGPSELADAYDACELLLHPSEQESFGMVCLEAWLRRRPVIANADCGASAALIDDDVDGCLLLPEADWAAATRGLLADPSRLGEMGAAGRRKALERFGWDRVCDRALAVYEGLAA